MPISELIKELEKMKEKHGDIQVCIPNICFGSQDGYADIETIKYNEEYDCIVVDDR